MVYRVTVGPSPQFEYVNPAVESVLGYDAEEFYDDPSLVIEDHRTTTTSSALRELAAVGVDRGASRCSCA